MICGWRDGRTDDGGDDDVREVVRDVDGDGESEVAIWNLVLPPTVGAAKVLSDGAAADGVPAARARLQYRHTVGGRDVQVTGRKPDLPGVSME